jgi:hypothetical protein
MPAGTIKNGVVIDVTAVIARSVADINYARRTVIDLDVLGVVHR